MHEEPLQPIDMSKCPVEPEVSVYYPDGTLIVRTKSELEFNYVRLQVLLYKLEGCFGYCNNERFEINPDGRINSWPSGLFESNDKIVSEIVRNAFKAHKANNE